MITGKAYYDQLLTTANQAHQKGDFKTAKALYLQLTRDLPDASDPYHMLGLIHAQDGEDIRASAYFEQAIDKNENHSIYRNNYAESLRRLSKLDEAISQLQKAIKIDDHFYPAKYKLASVYHTKGLFQEMFSLLDEVLRIKPDYVPALELKGVALLESMDIESANSYFEKSLTLKPNSVTVLNNLGVLHQQNGEMKLAIQYFEEALSIQPGYQQTLQNSAILYQSIGEHQKAKTAYLEWARQNNDNLLIQWKAESVGPAIYQSTEEIKTYRQKLIDQLHKIRSVKIKLSVDDLLMLGLHPPTDTPYHGLDELPLRRAYADLFTKIAPIKTQTPTNERPKMGIVVTQGHQGIFLKSMKGILNHLSTDQMEITIVWPNDVQTNYRSEIKNEKIGFLSLPHTLQVAAKCLADQTFDLIYYWEVGTDGMNYFLPYFKLAPIQCTGWGWPITSGHDRLDYFVSTRGLDDEATQTHYTEKLILLNKLPSYYYRPKNPDTSKTTKDFGLEENKNTYLCLQNLKKIHPDFDQILFEILSKDDQAQMVFIESEFEAINNQFKDRIRQNLRDHFSQLKFVSRLQSADYYQLIQLTDVVLDTIHYGGANTTYDTFAMNRPLVTLEGVFFRGRFAAQAYRQMGMPEMVTTECHNYVSMALRLATDRRYREKICEKIEKTSSRLFEDKEAVLEFEQTLKQLIERSRLH